MLSLKIKNLSFQYNDRILFQYNDFIFYQGITIIIAPSGKGKSTLFSLFIQEKLPRDGEILWNDKNIVYYDKKNFMFNEVAIVFQGAMVSYYFTLAQYIELLLLHRKQSTQNIADLYLKKLNITHLLHENIIHCSGGEKYKIACFLALLKNTPLLLLDEPTAHLDMENSIMLLDILQEITNKVIIIISHDEWLCKHKNFTYYFL